MKVLRIDASPMQQTSVSTKLSDHFVAQVTEHIPQAKFTTRDVVTEPIPALSSELVAAFYTQPHEQTAEQKEKTLLSNQLVEELEATDIIILGAGMYNFSISAHLKLYIDQIARVGRTFQYGANGPEGLLKNKKVFVFTAAGSNYSEGVMQSMDFVTPYLKTVLGFLGMQDVTFIPCYGVAGGAEAAEKQLTLAKAKITEEVQMLAK